MMAPITYCFISCLYKRTSLRNTRAEMEFETALDLSLGLPPLKPKQVGLALVQYFILWYSCLIIFIW